MNWPCFSLSLNWMLLLIFWGSWKWASYDNEDLLSISEWHLKCHFRYFLFRATCGVVKTAFLKIIILHQKRRYQSDPESYPIRNPIWVLLTALMIHLSSETILSVLSYPALSYWDTTRHGAFWWLKQAGDMIEVLYEVGWLGSRNMHISFKMKCWCNYSRP